MHRKYKNFQDYMSDMDKLGFYAFNWSSGKLKMLYPEDYKKFKSLSEAEGVENEMQGL